MSFGSQRGFPYTDDGGSVFAIRLDESNTELAQAGAGTPPVGATLLPSDIKPRFLRCRADNLTTKKLTILTRVRFDEIELGSFFSAPSVGDENAQGTLFRVIQKVPERRLRGVTALDTGKIDGDQP